MYKVRFLLEDMVIANGLKENKEIGLWDEKNNPDSPKI